MFAPQLFQRVSLFVFLVVFAHIHGAAEPQSSFNVLVNTAMLSGSQGDWYKVEESIHQGVISQAYGVWCNNGGCGDPQCCQTCAFECREACPLDSRVTCVTSARHSACMRSLVNSMLSEGCKRAAKFLCQGQCGLSCTVKTAPCKWCCNTFICSFLTTRFCRKECCNRKQVVDGVDCCDKVWGCLACPVFCPYNACCGEKFEPCFCPDTKRCCCRSAVPESVNVAITHFGEAGRKDVLEQIKLLMALNKKVRPVDLKIAIKRMGKYGVDRFIRVDGEHRVDAHLLAQAAQIKSTGKPIILSPPRQQSFAQAYGASADERVAGLKARSEQLRPLLDELSLDSKLCKKRVHAAAAWVVKELKVEDAVKEMKETRSTIGFGVTLLVNTLKMITQGIGRSVEWHTTLTDVFDLRRRLVMNKMQYITTPGCNLERLAAMTASWTDDEILSLLNLIIEESSGFTPVSADTSRVESFYREVWLAKKAQIAEKYSASLKYVSFYEPSLKPGKGIGFNQKIATFLEIYNLPEALDSDPAVIAHFAKDIADFTGSVVCSFKAADCSEEVFDFAQVAAALKELAGENVIILIDRAHELLNDLRTYSTVTGYITSSTTAPIVVTSASTAPLFGHYSQMLDAEMGEYDEERAELEADLYQGILLSDKDALARLKVKISGAHDAPLTSTYEHLKSIAAGAKRVSHASRLLTLIFLANNHARGGVAGYKVAESIQQANIYYSMAHGFFSSRAQRFQEEQSNAGFRKLSRQLMGLLAELRNIFKNHNDVLRDFDEQSTKIYGSDPVDRLLADRGRGGFGAILSSKYASMFKKRAGGDAAKKASFLAQREAAMERHRKAKEEVLERMKTLLKSFAATYPPGKTRGSEIASRGGVWRILLAHMIETFEGSHFGDPTYWVLEPGDGMEMVELEKVGIGVLEADVVEKGLHRLGLPSDESGYKDFFKERIEFNRPEVLFLLLNLCILAEFHTKKVYFDWLMHGRVIYSRLSTLAQKSDEALRLKEEFLMLYFGNSEADAKANWGITD